jgi:hypothetical protein
MPKKKESQDSSAANTTSFKVPDYSEEERAYRSDIIGKLTLMRAAYNSEHNELNGMNFQEYYDSNLRAANSFIPPKKNPEDTRIVSGTTEEKENTLLSAILNYNLEPNILAYDDDDMEVDELGNNMSDMIKKSRELENYAQRRPLIYKELLDQGTCYVEEQWVEESKLEKKLANVNWADGVSVSKIKWSEKEVAGFVGCRTRLMRGDKVLLGNIHEYELEAQPYIATIDVISRAQFDAIYKNWERADFVPDRIVREVESDDSTYRMWTLEIQQEGFVELIKWYDPWKNEFMLMANGVMMLPVGFPLTAISPSGDYPIAKGGVYPISQFFALGKSIPAKTKVDQEVLDEMLKLIILKTRKSFMPPLANNTGRMLSRKIFNAGEITNQVDPAKIQPIGDVQGVSQSEFNAYQFIKGIVDQKSVSPSFMGESTPGRQTATEISEIKKQQMMKLGLVIYGVISLEQRLSWLRIYNILENWTKVQDTKINEFTGKLEAVYKTMTVDTQMEDTQKGKKIIQFSTDAPEFSPEQVMEEENQLSSMMRMPVKKVYIHPDISKVKYNWYITINPTEKDSSDLHRIMFKQDIQDAITLFGPQSLNMPYLQKRYATLAKEDPEKFFNTNIPAVPTEAAMKGGDQGGLGAQLNRGMGTAAAPQQQAM